MEQASAQKLEHIGPAEKKKEQSRQSRVPDHKRRESQGGRERGGIRAGA